MCSNCQLLHIRHLTAATESGGKCGRPGGPGEGSAIILLQRECGAGNSGTPHYTGVVECQSQEISYCQSYVSDRSKTERYNCRGDMSFLKSKCEKEVCKITSPHGGGICGADQKDKEIKFLRSVSASETTRRSPADAGLRAGKNAVDDYWRRTGSNCDNRHALDYRGEQIKKNKFPLGSDNWKTNVRNTSARTGVDQEVKKIKDECSAPESPADAGLKAGKKAVDDYWRRNGSDCGNMFALHYRGEEIKKNEFPLGSDNWKTNVRNTSARTGVDQEVDRIFNRCINDEGLTGSANYYFEDNSSVASSETAAVTE